MTRLRTHHPVRAAALGLATLLATDGEAGAQVDYLPLALEVTQSIQNGNQGLIAARPTFLRTTVRMVNGGANPPAVDGLLYVYDDGVEVEGSPFFSDNGPYVPPNPPDKSFLDGTLNFTILPPAGDNVTFEIVVNPAGPTQVPGEANPNNNVLSAGPYEFVVRTVPDMIYSPIDYRPGGGTTPNPPDEALIRPGVGDNFIQGIYPVPDWNYYRTDAPSKLWTSSLSGSGSTLNNSLTTDLNLTVPQPDYIYGWVPGSLPYNGQAIIGGVASMGNTQPIRHQRTFAHELGHCTGLFHDNTTAGVYGIDVEHHLAITELLPKVKPPSALGIMVAGQLTQSAWCESGDYGVWFNLGKFQANDAAALDAGDEVPLLLVSGAWNTATGAVTTHDVLTLPEPGRLSPSAPSSEILIGAFAGDGLVRQIRVGTVTSSDCSDSLDDASPLVGFNALMPALSPAGEPVDRIVISQGGQRGLSTTVLERSEHAPEVAFTAPTGTVLEDGLLTVAWEGSDADGDALTYYLRWSRDGQEFSPLHTSTRDTSFTVDVSGLPALVDGQGFFELLASDGLNTSVVRTAPLQRGASYAGSNTPWAHILTPDNNVTLLEGQNAILHGMAWDIEDDGLTGGDVVWTSDVDGLIGSGRRITTDSLSPGAHQITLTVTDSDGQQGTWVTNVTVAARDLPDIDGEVCQVDLGNGGPGSAFLEICGGNLSTGTTADLNLTGAPANTTAWLVIGSSNTPTPFKGGTLVPVPVLDAIAVNTDGAGNFAITGIPGGGGPATFYVQFVIVDGGQTLGFGLSNAVQVDYLP